MNFPGWGTAGDKNSPDALSPCVMAWQPDLQLCRALYDGWQGLYEQRKRFLPQHPAEDEQDYYIRANRRTFYNAFARTVHALAGLVFNVPPTPEGVPPAIQALYDDDIDNQGTTGDTFLLACFRDALVTGLTGILVDVPASEPGLTRAEEIERGMRPYWTMVRKDDIVSFRPTVEDGRTLLARLVLREYVHVDDGTFGVKCVERLRVFRRIPANPPGAPVPVIRYEVWQRSTGTDKFQRVDTGQITGVTEIPFAPIYTGRVDFMDATPPLVDLANLNLLHYQMWSDLAHAAHVANVPVLFGTGMSAEQVTIGPNRAIIIEAADAGAQLRWLETTGASLGSTRAILSDLEEQMANLGLAMLQRKSRAAETAQKATLDRQNEYATLGAMVADLEDGIELALDYTAQFLGLPEGGSLKFNTDYVDTAPAEVDPTQNQGGGAPPPDPKLPGRTNNPRTTGA